MQAPALRWGVLGPGWIAERFVTAVQRSTTQQVVAVGSRTLQRSAEFADRFGIATAHGSYQALVSDPAVDVIYVATPHNAHFPCAAMAIEAGKHVLVEKPIGLNAGEAGRLAELASQRGVFCMLADTMIPEAYEHGGKLTGVVTTLGFVVAFAIHQAS